MTIRQAIAREKLHDLERVLNRAEVQDIETLIEIEELQDKIDYEKYKMHRRSIRK